MADLGETIGLELRAARAGAFLPPGEQLGARDLLAAILAASGTVTAAAQAVGIDRRTWQRLTSGRHAKPSAATRAKLNAAYEPIRRRRMAGRWGEIRARMVAKSGRLAVKAVFCVSNDCRRRAIQFRNVLTSATREAIVSAAEDGDPDEAAALFNAGISREYVPGMYVEDGSVEWIRWA